MIAYDFAVQSEQLDQLARSMNVSYEDWETIKRMTRIEAERRPDRTPEWQLVERRRLLMQFVNERTEAQIDQRRWS